MVLIGTDYWAGLLEWMRREAIARGAISPQDLDILDCTDDMEEACRMLTASSTRRAEEAARAAKAAGRTVGHKP